MIQPWKILSSEPVVDCRIFKVRKDAVVSPRNGSPHDMFIIENPGFMNVVPITADGQLILIEQWRHGTRQVHLETPGGLIDDGESPSHCARRELLEETGYEAGKVEPLGTVYPNPAIQNNRQHFFLATGCRKVAEPQFDHAEDIILKLVPVAKLPELVRSGAINHALVMTGLYLYSLRQGK
jgi:ADP-ribose pyrophosphatase